MRVAIVGNGPSAKGHGATIDACHKVVRCNGWQMDAAQDCGTKLDAWALYGDESIAHATPIDQGEVWLTLPASRCRPIVPDHCGNILVAYTMAANRPIRWITEAAWAMQLEYLMRLNGGRWAAPSTGFTAIDMALRVWAPRELLLFGFDATAPGAPGWGDAGGDALQWPDMSTVGHCFQAEKAALAEFRDKHTWLGNPCRTRVIWPGPCA